MAAEAERITKIRPDLIRRKSGGWLAVAPYWRVSLLGRHGPDRG
jgi:hypothetical protein